MRAASWREWASRTPSGLHTSPSSSTKPSAATWRAEHDEAVVVVGFIDGVRERGAEVHGEVDGRDRRRLREPREERRDPRVGVRGDGEVVDRTRLRRSGSIRRRPLAVAAGERRIADRPPLLVALAHRRDVPAAASASAGSARRLVERHRVGHRDVGELDGRACSPRTRAIARASNRSPCTSRPVTNVTRRPVRSIRRLHHDIALGRAARGSGS